MRRDPYDVEDFMHDLFLVAVTVLMLLAIFWR